MSIDLTNERDVVEDFIGEIPFNALVLANYNLLIITLCTLVDEIKNAFNIKKSPTVSITLSVFLLLILSPPPQLSKYVSITLSVFLLLILSPPPQLSKYYKMLIKHRYS
ncbi:MAG: hypothetical protein RXR59_05630 [Sulfolobus sp.]